MTTKQTLPELLESSSDKKFLFLGREGLFTQDEIARFLKKHHITMTKYLEEDVVAIIEPLNLNPIEEDISNNAYEKKIPSFSLDAFEKHLSDGINDDELLMAIKLSNDQARVKRLLGNEHFCETLFLKLLMMYAWHDEEEDDRDDRDVIMYTLRRYIQIGINEEDLLYSYLTLRRLVIEANNPKLLLVLISFPNFSFVVRGKETVTLQQMIARNPYIDQEVITTLSRLKDIHVDTALAANPTVPLSYLEKSLAKKESVLDHALAMNPSIDNKIFQDLLSKDDKTIQLLLYTQPIDNNCLMMIKKAKLEKELFNTLGANERLSLDVIEELLSYNNHTLHIHLAQNPTLSTQILNKLYQKKDTSLYEALAANPNSEVSILEELYHADDSTAIAIALANNPCTPVSILRELFARDSFEIYKSLASNGSLPLDLLDRLKIDTRLQNQLAQNPIMKQWYSTVMDYDKNAGQLL